MATLKIRAANAASMASLAPHLPRTQTQNHASYTISLVAAADLSPALQDRIYALFHTNMSPLSASTSMSYAEPSKREELFDPSGRYILLRRLGHEGETVEAEVDPGVDMPGGLPSKGKRRAQGPEVNFDPDELVGYVSFRFDTEETLGSKDAEVVYCYELQLDSAVRKMGFGKVLMDEMEAIGRRRGMDKAMLTCLKGNTTALAFYEKQGYEADEIDPTRMASEPDSDSDDEEWEQVGVTDDEEEEQGDGDTEYDYVILSKPLR